MQLSVSSKASPRDMTRRGENPPPPGQSLCTKSLQKPGQNNEFKCHTPRQKILTLSEMKSFVVSTNKTVFQ